MTTTTIETKVSHKVEQIGRIGSYSIDFSPYRRGQARMSICLADGEAHNIPIPLELAKSIGAMLGGTVKMTLEFSEPLLRTSTFTS